MGLVALLFGFKGRINRARFWLAALIWVAVAVIGVFASVLAGYAPDDRLTGFPLFAVFFFGMVALISSLAISAKRLHDRDKSTRWLLLFYLVPALLSVAGFVLIGGEEGRLMGDVFALPIYVWYVVELGCLRGTPGPNTYGPDPLAGGMSAQAA